jgi:hypothetical protein
MDRIERSSEVWSVSAGGEVSSVKAVKVDARVVEESMWV